MENIFTICPIDKNKQMFYFILGTSVLGGLFELNDDYRYLILDLKSFYASVECVERGYDPFTTNLVVADPDREKGTICLAITPALKALGVKNRCICIVVVQRYRGISRLEVIRHED